MSAAAAAAAGLATAVGTAAAVYALAVRPWHEKWGATQEEADRSLPGDEVVPRPRIRATHAITIHAPAFGIWPWIAQIGVGRGGFYSYDWIENAMGLEVHSTDQILTQHQQVEAGQIIPLMSNGEGVPVIEASRDHHLALGGRITSDSPGSFRLQDADPNAYMEVAWTFFLQPVDENVTRLIERFSIDWGPGSLKNALFMYAFLEPGAFLMERKMLLGIKERAEKYAARVYGIAAPGYPPKG